MKNNKHDKEIELQNKHKYAVYHILNGYYDDLILKRITNIIHDIKEFEQEIKKEYKENE